MELGPAGVGRDTGRRDRDGTTFPHLRSIYTSGVRAQRSVVGGASAKIGRGEKYPLHLHPPPPSGSPASGPGPARREKRGNMRGRRPPAAQPGVEERRAEGVQVARLSAGRPDMRIWELLLLRMESWVPPFTPLLARDGCRCLKSTAK